MSKRVFQTPRYPGTSYPQSDESIPLGAVVLPQDGTNDEAVRMSAWGLCEQTFINLSKFERRKDHLYQRSEIR